MIRGVRKSEEARALGVSRRLLVRIGALLGKSLEVSPALLETARPGTPMEALLLDPALLERSADLDDGLLRSLADKHLGAAVSAYDRPAVARSEGVCVLCLREELEAEEAWADSAPAPQAEPEPARVPVPDRQALVARPESVVPARPLVERLAAGAGKGSETLFTPVELDRLRLRLVTSAEKKDRIEALRLLAYAPLPLQEKAEVIFRALEDRDADVRAEGAEMLFTLGVGDELTSGMRALSEGSEELRGRAADRLVLDLAGEVPVLARAAIAVCALAALKGEPPGPLAARLVDVLHGSAIALTGAPGRIAELIRVTLGLLATALGRGAPPRANQVCLPLLRLYRRLCREAPALALPLFREERGKCTDRGVEAFLLQILLDATPAGDPGEMELIRTCANFVAHDTEEGRDSRGVGSALAARGEAAVVPLVEAFEGATVSGQRYLVRLIDDLVRYRETSAESKARAAAMVLRAAEASYRPLRLTALGCRGIAHESVPDETRRKLAEAFLNSVGELAFKPDQEIAEDTVAFLGLPAIEPLVARLAKERPPDQRVQAARILGRLALELKPAAGRMAETQAAVTELLRRLQPLAFDPGFPSRRELLTAMGKLAASPAASKEAGAVVTRHLMDDVKSGDPRRRQDAMEGLSWLASSRRAQFDLVALAVDLLEESVQEVERELSLDAAQPTPGKMLQIPDDKGLMEFLPVALAGLSRIACSRSCPNHLRRDAVLFLTERWQGIVRGTAVWGPTNSAFLVQALREIGSHDGLSDELRMEILKALAPRLMFIPVLPAIGAILAASDGPGTAPAALTIGLKIVAARGPGGRYEADDRPHVARALAQIAARRHLGAPDREGQQKARGFRTEVVEDLMRWAQDLQAGAHDGLVLIRDAKVLEPEAQATLEKRLSEMYALALPGM